MHSCYTLSTHLVSNTKPKCMNKIALISVLATIAMLGSFFNPAWGEEYIDLTCPQMCEESRDNCEFSCSQLIGGGAKAEKRRECNRGCGKELEGCNVRCLNPTPRPTLKPEAYHDRACRDACDLKLVDCNEVCTKYTGGGAKSGKKSVCRSKCAESSDYCKKRCADPSLPERLDYPEKPDLSCSEDCDYKLRHCKSGCSVYIGGGAKSGKRSKCVSGCKAGYKSCSGLCSE